MSTDFPWTKLELQSSSMKASVQAVKDAAIPVVDAVVTIIKTIEAVAELILTFFVDLADPLVAAVLAALDAVKSIIEEIFQDAGLYALFVPPVSNPGYVDNAAAQEIYKRYSYDIYNTPLSDLNAEKNQQMDLAVAQMSQDLVAKQAANKELLGVDTSNPAATLLLGAGNGGNAGFYRTVADSLNDRNDPNRPAFGNKSYMAGLVFFGGANTYGEFMNLWQRLSRLLRGPSGGAGGFGASMDNPFEAKAGGLRARVVSSFADEPSGSSDGLYAVKLSWDPLPGSWICQALNVTLKIYQIHIYKSNRPISATTPVDQLEKLDTIDYNPLKSHYYDKKTKFSANTTVYYAVGFTFKDPKEGFVIGDGNPGTLSKTVLQFGSKLSVDVGHGVPPDWIAGNALDMFPIIKEFIDVVLQWINDIQDGLRTAKKMLEDFVNFLKGYIEYYANWLLDIANTIKAMLYLFDLPNVYVGTYTFWGEGGNQFLLDTLADKLSGSDKIDNIDLQIKKVEGRKAETAQQILKRREEIDALQAQRAELDPNAPPFTKGSELVGGVILLAGAEHPSGVDKAIALFKLFSATADAKSAALTAALNSMEPFDKQLQDLGNAAWAAAQEIGNAAAGGGNGDNLLSGTATPGVESTQYVNEAPENIRTGANGDKIAFDSSMNPTKIDGRC